MVELGSFALLSAFILTVYATAASLISGRRNSPALAATAERTVYAVCALLSIAMYALLLLLARSDFSVAYVANYTNRELPVLYKLTALWAGHDGSLLFWAWLLSVYSTSAVFRYRNSMRNFMPYVVMILMGTAVFFTFLVYFISNPFRVLVSQEAGGAAELFIPADGRGLNPLLQHPAMAIHPPVLYLGFVGFAVPFAFAIAALITGKLGDAWFQMTRRWTLFAWLFLGAGIFLGGKWAYVELGWGGYWAWDPVENASLMPWLTGTAFIHSTMIQEKRGMLKRWNMALILLTYLLCIFGTFLTRSGIVSSVHAFASSSIGPMFSAFLAAGTVLSIALYIYRFGELKSENRLDSMISRESGFLFNNLLFLTAFFAVLWGTMFPVLSEAVKGVQITVGPPFFNRINTPLGLLLLFLTAVGPLFAWRRTSMESLKRNFLIPGTGALLTLIVLISLGMRHLYALISFTLAAFVVFIVCIEFHRGALLRAKQIMRSYPYAFLDMIRRNKRRYGSHIVHFAVALAFIGMAGAAFNTEVQQEVAEGDSFGVRDYTVRIDKIEESRTPNYMVWTITMELMKGGAGVAVLKPEKRYYLASEQPTSEVRIHSTLAEDVYAVFAGMNETTGKAVLKVYVNPLVNWFWIGGLGIVLGTILCMLPDRRSENRVFQLKKIREKETRETVA